MLFPYLHLRKFFTMNKHFFNSHSAHNDQEYIIKCNFCYRICLAVPVRDRALSEVTFNRNLSELFPRGWSRGERLYSLAPLWENKRYGPQTVRTDGPVTVLWRSVLVGQQKAPVQKCSNRKMLSFRISFAPVRAWEYYITILFFLYFS